MARKPGSGNSLIASVTRSVQAVQVQASKYHREKITADKEADFWMQEYDKLSEKYNQLYEITTRQAQILQSLTLAGVIHIAVGSEDIEITDDLLNP